MMTKIFHYIFCIITLAGLYGCIEDGFSSSAADQPVFSTDTLDLGAIFTEQPSVTHRFIVHNPSSKAISIGSVGVSGPGADCFRLNVDGFSGRQFQNVEIRANDSIFIFVEATLPQNGQKVPVAVEASVDFLTMGQTRSVVLTAQGRDVIQLRAKTLTANSRLEAGKPYQVFDSLVVAPGAKLTIDPGAELFFHDGAMMVVRGTLDARGTQGKEITFAGDRTGFVAADIPFDIMSRQWLGMFFTSTSRDNLLDYVHICNTVQGVIVDGTEAKEPLSIQMHNSRLRNSGNYCLEMHHASLEAVGCEFAEAAMGPLWLDGGEHSLNFCTVSNNYLFTAIGAPLLSLSHFNDDTADETGLPLMKLRADNSIFHGIGSDLSHGDLTGSQIIFNHCLFKSEGSDDDNFLSSLWGADPKFNTVREEYIFDYTVQEGSDAIDAADLTLMPSPQWLTDRLGTPRRTTAGAYEFVAK